MSDIIIEVCCGGIEDALEAYRGGADRIELNSCLFHGGLTPSVGTLITAKQRIPIPVMAMVRPRQGGFCYTEAEFETAVRDAQVLLDNGADGIVFGFLNADGTVDTGRCRRLKEVAGDRTTVFHRAIDVCPDWKKAVRQLIDIGIDRILTSGQAPDVYYGLQTIREMIEFSAGAIQILPGAGITLRNAESIVRDTGCSQIHVAHFTQRIDPSTSNNRDIFFGGALYPPEDRYDVIDGDYVARIRKQF